MKQRLSHFREPIRVLWQYLGLVDEALCDLESDVEDVALDMLFLIRADLEADEKIDG